MKTEHIGSEWADEVKITFTITCDTRYIRTLVTDHGCAILHMWSRTQASAPTTTALTIRIMKMGRTERPTRAGLAASLQSKEAFVEYLQAPQGNDNHTAIGDSKWSNKDLQPTSVEDRTWTWYVVRNFVQTSADYDIGTTCLFTGSLTNFL